MLRNLGIRIAGVVAGSAMVLATAFQAEAAPRRYYGGGGGNGGAVAALAIGALALGVGAAIASSQRSERHYVPAAPAYGYGGYGYAPQPQYYAPQVQYVPQFLPQLKRSSLTIFLSEFSYSASDFWIAQGCA